MKATKNNFLDLKPGYSDLVKSKVVIIPFGLEESVSYGGGTKNGPKAIIAASHDVELFDEELEKEIYREIGIATVAEKIPLAPFAKGEQKKGAKKAVDQIYKITKEALDLNKFPIILGGEHTLTIGPLKAFLEKYSGGKDFTLLQFDAHADLRDSYKKDKYSHGAVMRRCLELDKDFNLVQIGIRNISNEPGEGSEFDFWRDNQERITTFWAKDQDQWRIEDIIKACRENIYLTFDVDAFDTGIMPSTGTPEPGGLGWYQVLRIIKAIAEKKKIIGADFVELAPIKGLNSPDFMTAKLIYKTIGYIFSK